MNNHGPNFLLVGLERSGTHWVSALLNAHPEVACFPSKPFIKESGEYSDELGEVHLFNTLASFEPNTEGKFTRSIDNYISKHQNLFTDLVHYKDEVDKKELYKIFIKRYNEICDSQKKGKKLVGESTPAYIFHLDFIDQFYPEIKKICIIRDPKDRVVSWHFNQIRKKRKTEEYISDEFITDYCTQRIKKEYESLLAYQGEVHCLTYEFLSQQTVETIKKMLEYLSVKIDDKIVAQMIEEADFKKLTAKDSNSVGREKGQESINSYYRKGIVGDWQSHFSDRQINLVTDMLGDLQKEVFNKYNIK